MVGQCVSFRHVSTILYTPWVELAPKDLLMTRSGRCTPLEFNQWDVQLNVLCEDGVLFLRMFFDTIQNLDFDRSVDFCSNAKRVQDARSRQNLMVDHD